MPLDYKLLSTSTVRRKIMPHHPDVLREKKMSIGYSIPVDPRRDLENAATLGFYSDVQWARNGPLWFTISARPTPLGR